MDARNAWLWQRDFIWVFNVRAVGAYFSGVTGWPPGSVGVWLGVFFAFAPRPNGLKIDDKGRLRPPEHVCHMRSHLVRRLDQAALMNTLQNHAERRRTDIWWVDPGGENAELVADDITTSLVSEGLPWYSQASNPEVALSMVEAEPDCFVKFTKAALLAKHLGDETRWQKYDVLADAEARRIGRRLDRNSWFGV